jgi:hypothetical protein
MAHHQVTSRWRRAAAESAAGLEAEAGEKTINCCYHLSSIVLLMPSRESWQRLCCSFLQHHPSIGFFYCSSFYLAGRFSVM